MLLGIDETYPVEDEDTPKAETPKSKEQTDYERYHAMSGAEQKKFMDSFGSVEAFFEWYSKAKEENDALTERIAADSLEIDMSAFSGEK